ncbi:MAG: GFA family protein [Thalassobaculum sp.]
MESSREYRRRSDSGHDVENHFCPTCGSTVFWFAHRMPDLIAVAPGAFADPHFPKPVKAVYGQYRHDWVHLDIPES